MSEDRPVVPASALSETTEAVFLFRPSGAVLEIKPEQLQALDLSGLAVGWVDDAGKIHRVVGLPLEVVTVASRILKPV